MKLKEIREEKELKQAEVAKILGVSRSSYAMWENEKDIIPLLRLNQFCNYFHVSIDYALGLINIKNYQNEKLEINREKLMKRLKTLRKKNNYTQLELSQKLKITRSLISKYETNNNLILTNFLLEYSRFFNISCDYLVGKIDTPIKLKILVKN